jgi:hypothetical protein
VGMSALGQKQTYAVQNVMFALPPIATAKADMGVTRLPGRGQNKKSRTRSSATAPLGQALLKYVGAQDCDPIYFR